MTVAEAIERVSRWLDKGTQHEASQLGYIEGWFTKDDEQAFLMAIRSLEAWDKVLDELRKDGSICGSIWVEYTTEKDKINAIINGVLKQAKQVVLEIIDKHLKEIVE